MRDFRDAKAMAHTLRAALATKGQKVTNNESLELIAQAIGVADWNTLSAAIRAEAAAPRNNPAPTPSPTIERVPGPPLSAKLESTLHRALANANQRKHQYATLEQDFNTAEASMSSVKASRRCNVDLSALKDHLTSYIDKELKLF
jgi:hypothetical protein